jgi:hypothetical protein
MSTRRDALRLLTIAPAALASAQQTKEVETQPGHVQTPAPAAPLPGFLQPPELQAIEAMSERIIPHTDTPGAKDVGVAHLIDKAIVADPSLMQPYRAGIADLNNLAIGSYGKEFAALDEKQQNALLTNLSLETNSDMSKFFQMVKDMTIDAYYKTEAGLKTELGWHGNTFLASFPGCDHPEHQS